MCLYYYRRSSKWDQGPDISQTVTVQQDSATAKPVKVSRFDQGPVKSSKWDKPASKWDKLPGDVVKSSESNGDVTRSSIQAASEAAAKVNAMLMAKGVFKPAQPLIVNESVLKAKPVSWKFLCNNSLYYKQFSWLIWSIFMLLTLNLAFSCFSIL